jgi:hypothetical protein
MSTPITVLGITSLWPANGETDYAAQTLQLQQSLAAAVLPTAGLYNGNTGHIGNLSLSDSDELLLNGSPITIGGVTSFNTRTGHVTLNGGDIVSALGYTPGSVSSISVNGTSGNLVSSGSPVTLTSLDVTTALTFTPCYNNSNSR